MDQRRSESLGRFLQVRAMKLTKNPLKKPESAGLLHPLRWRLSIRRLGMTVRFGIIGAEASWGERGPVANNISMSANRIGVVIYPLLRLIPGQTVRCLNLMWHYNIADDWA
jgi:hypothetical protein